MPTSVMTMDKQPLKKVEGPRDLRKKNKRLETSRDAIKVRIRDKALKIKHLSGKIDDINESRERWQQSYEKEVFRSKKLEAELDKERQLVQQLRIEVESFKKKR